MKQRIQGIIIGTVLAVVLLGGIAYVTVPQATARTVERWEYIQISRNTPDLMQEINRLGNEGWELVLQSDHIGFVFKRRLP